MDTETFDKLRNLEQHKTNLMERNKKPEGVCLLCASFHCKFNITSKNVLEKVGNVLVSLNDGIPDIEQYLCDDLETDSSVPTDLLKRRI